MPADLRFDGRVVIVTGAGRGIGRAYAQLLAARGAAVVVNDLGGSIGGDGSDAGPAGEVVDEITAAGGTAVADTSDVSSPEGGAALVDGAVERLGPVDIVIANAGIMRWADMSDVDADALDAHLAVHVGGAFHLVRAVWPSMVERGFGRIVLTTSSGVFGLPNNLAYATAKGGVIGMVRSLAVTGRKAGIAVNAIAPGAFTRMAGPGEASPEMAPELVAPMAAYLAHDDCPVTGEIYTAGFGRFARLFIGSTPGWAGEEGQPTVDDVAAHWDAINDESGYTVPRNLPAWSAEFMSHLQPPSG